MLNDEDDVKLIEGFLRLVGSKDETVKKQKLLKLRELLDAAELVPTTGSMISFAMACGLTFLMNGGM
jgi:hypothetical protein